MPLIIAHGEPKSGSSFLAQISFGAARLANGPSTQIRAEIKRHGVITPRFEFSSNITDDGTPTRLGDDQTRQVRPPAHG